MDIQKTNFIEEVSTFNRIKHFCILDYAEMIFNGQKSESLNEDNVVSIIFDNILQNNPGFIAKKVTKATNYNEWLKEVEEISEKSMAFIVIKKEIEIEQAIGLFEFHLSELNQEEIYESSSYNDDSESSFFNED